MDFLEYPDVTAEIKGSMVPGRLKLTDQNMVFKNAKTGKVEQVSSGDIELVNWQRLSGAWGLRVFLKNGVLHRFGGFKDSDQEKLAKFFSQYYKKDMLEKELSVKGWNWGRAVFHGSTLSFDIGSSSAFEIPLNNVSQCTTGKNEVTLEFHQNDDAPVSLMEMRFFIPSSELAGDDPVEAFQNQVMQKASVISATGDAIAIFREAQCLTPRGRYDIKVFQTFVQLHGKTFDYKIPISTVLRLFLLPHKDGRQIFFVVSLDPPIKQGQTRYHFLVLLFNKDEEVTFELPMSEEEVKEKFEGRLSRENSGPTYEVLGKIMKGLANRKVTVPGNFVGFSGTPAIGCSYKAAAGYVYPLERGFIYVHKPPIHIRFEEITSVNFARSGGSTRSFDFEVETKNGVVHTFSSIEKEEYGRLYDFISNKKLRVKNSGRSDKPSHMDDFGDSDVEDAPDAYLARVKAEGIEREAQGDDSESNSDEETDEDFKPGEEGSDVAEEFDSNVSSSDDDDSDQSGGSDKKAKKEKKKKKDKEKKPRKSKADDDKPKKPRRPKKEKDENKPKRPQSAYFLWLNSNRDKIKAENPGISITELTKKAGELWKKLEDKSQWEAKAAKEKEAYEKAMKEYKASGGASNEKEKDKGSAKSSSKTKSPAKSDAFASKEFISTSEDSSDDEDKKKSQKKPAVKKESKTADKSAKKKNKKESEDEDEEEEEDMDVSSASSASSDSD